MARQLLLAGKAPLGRRKAELVAHQVHQVGRVAPVVDGEARLQPDARRVFAQQPRRDRVEGPGPDQPVREHRGLWPQDVGGDHAHALDHLCRRAARECHQQDAPGISPGDDQVRQPVDQRVRLAGSRPGDDQQGIGAMQDGGPLIGIQPLEIAGIGRHWGRDVHGRRKHRLRFVRNRNPVCPVFFSGTRPQASGGTTGSPAPLRSTISR